MGNERSDDWSRRIIYPLNFNNKWHHKEDESWDIKTFFKAAAENLNVSTGSRLSLIILHGESRSVVYLNNTLWGLWLKARGTDRSTQVILSKDSVMLQRDLRSPCFKYNDLSRCQIKIPTWHCIHCVTRVSYAVPKKSAFSGALINWLAVQTITRLYPLGN